VTQQKLRLVLASACFFITAVVAATTWYSTGDANSYLDMARFVSERNWAAAVNPFWGLSYAWVLGFFFTIFGPDPKQEVVAVRVTNIVMLLLTIGTFDFLLGGLLNFLRSRTETRGRSMLSEPVLCIVAYALLLWSCFCLNWPSRISPDMLVSAIFFAAVGLLLRISIVDRPIRNSVLFALTMIIAYYTKAVFVPLGMVMLGCFALVLWQARKLWPALPLALLILAIGCAPYYRAVARQTKGVPNAASLNYAWHVNGLWYFIHWHGEGTDVGTPIHPTQQITQGLRAYAFAEPIHATYPPWYDPSYWYAGFRANFHPGQQITVAKDNLISTLRELLAKPVVGAVALCMVLLLVWNGSVRKSFWVMLALWPMLIPSLAACAIYIAVHLELRYVQPMVLCLLLALLSPLRAREEISSPLLGKFSGPMVGSAVAGFIVLATLLSIIGRARHVIDYVSLSNPLAHNVHWVASQQIIAMGVQPGSKVAVIGNGGDCLWAFLAKLRIIAELPHDYDGMVHMADADSFWTAPAAQQQEVMTAFRNTGAAFVIAEPRVPVKPPADWVPLKNTGYYYHSLGDAPPDASGH
jgi:hypothetical protein